MNKNIYTTINLDNLKHNFEYSKSLLKNGVKFCGLAKADAYGHGSIEIAKFYEEIGVDYITVARLEEAAELRKHGIKLPILLLGYSDDIETILNLDIEVTIYSFEIAKLIDEFVTNGNLGGKKLKVHIKLDTGMSRLGFFVHDNFESAANKIEQIYKMPNLEIVGIFTHFSDARDESVTNLQLSKFNKIVELLESKNITIPLKHTANSSALLSRDDAHFNMVRSGIVLFGYDPDGEKNPNLKPVMSFYAMIINIKTLPKGARVSYGGVYKTKENEKIATLSIGYADGFLRTQNEPFVLIKGVKCPVVGRICMDQCMVKLPFDMDVKIGDYATIFDENLTVDEVAKNYGTISYEVLCMVSRRVPRVYIKNSKIFKMVDYLI
ncbi:MAG: alanine racemase [Campylobacteraceae bacterium]|nr:alanine racemase [Campylobacteraceae bacterium]